MKRILFLLIVFALLVSFFDLESIFAQQVPTKLTKQERIAALQIPEDELKKLSTEELLDRCLEYPYLGDLIFVENIPLMFPYIIESFNGLTELFNNRDDAGIVLLNELYDVGIIIYIGNLTGIEKCAIEFKYYYLILFLAQDEMLEQLRGSERIILEELEDKFHQIGKYKLDKSGAKIIYNSIPMNFFGYAMAQYLNSIKYDKFVKFKENNLEIRNMFQCFNINFLTSGTFSALLEIMDEFNTIK